MCLAIPGQVVDVVDVAKAIAKVDITGVRRNVNIALIQDLGIQAGDWVLVHVGFAMSKIDESEAQETLALLRSMGSVFDDEVAGWDESRIE